tara:strand:+ start:94 stop:780 length:687 start_codon:yes stop_codon:yes gene_type:complete
MREVFLDTETTGLLTREDHRVLEIACIETENLIPTKNSFYKLINPEREITEEAFKVHGISSGRLIKEKKFAEIADELIEFIANKKLIIHNAPFDIGFLNHEFKKAGKPLIDSKKKDIIDSLELARSKFPGSSNSLDNLCKRYNIDLSARKKHNALLDCELLRKVYINLVGQKEPTLKFKDNLNSASPLDINDKIKEKKQYSKIVIQPFEEEIENHKTFIKREFKKNYF